KSPGRWIVEGAEALVRWEHPEYGLLYPRDFIGIAEESGLIIELTDFVFRAAMEQTRVWFANGLYMEIGVNLSARFLGDLGFPDRLLTLVRENNLDPSMVTIELTDAASTKDAAVALDILARLRVKNVTVCLDDFGTGTSSLMHLYRMPFSEVKIDNQFIGGMRLREAPRQGPGSAGRPRGPRQGARRRRRGLERRRAREGEEDRLKVPRLSDEA